MNKKLGIIVTASAAIILLIAAYCAYNYTEKGYSPAYPNDVVSTSSAVSAEELRAFLKTWHQYLQDDVDKMGVPLISQTTDSSAEEANPQVARWLKRKGWDADRFYYIETRLRAIIATIKRDEFILNNNQLILMQAENSPDEDIAQSLKKFAREQLQKLNIEQITPAERAMVSAQFKEIVALLKGSQK